MKEDLEIALKCYEKHLAFNFFEIFEREVVSWFCLSGVDSTQSKPQFMRIDTS